MVLHFLAQATYALGRYSEAAILLKRRILRNPETDASRALLAAAYGQMGMTAEAREAWRGLMSVNPNYSIEHRRKVLPYKNPDDFEPFVEGLRKAGLPGGRRKWTKPPRISVYLRNIGIRRRAGFE
jgi:adenylate cyclase